MSPRYQLACLWRQPGWLSECPFVHAEVVWSLFLHGLFLYQLPSASTAIRSSSELNWTERQAARGITLAINRDPSFSLTRQIYLDDHVHELTATRKYPEQQKSEQQLGKIKRKKKKKKYWNLKSIAFSASRASSNQVQSRNLFFRNERVIFNLVHTDEKWNWSLALQW